MLPSVVLRDWQTQPMTFEGLPRAACWMHKGLRSGFGVSFFTPEQHGLRIEGTTTGFQENAPWIVSYEIVLDELWKTRHAEINSRTDSGSVEQVVECDGEGHWLVDGEDAEHLTGCLDIDLEASAMTNALPVHRLDLTVGESVAAPAAYVRLANRGLERLEQTYLRLDDQDGLPAFDYEAAAFDFRCRIIYDHTRIVREYPGIGSRVG
jgi:uncharacterized protein